MWLVYRIRHSRFGNWFVNLRETRKAKREAKRLAELAGKQKTKGGEEQSLSETEGDHVWHAEDFKWEGMLEDDSGGESERPKGKKKSRRKMKKIRKVKKLFKRKKGH